MVVIAMRVMLARGPMMQSMMCPFMKTLQPHYRYPQDQPEGTENARNYNLLTIHGCKESTFSFAYLPNHCRINNSMALIGFDARTQAQFPFSLINFRFNPSL